MLLLLQVFLYYYYFIKLNDKSHGNTPFSRYWY